MKALLAPLTTPAYVLLRFVSGLLFACHGLQKVFGVLADPSHPQAAVGTQMWVGGVIELVCGLGIALGIFTSVAAFIASGEMAVAYFQFHWPFWQTGIDERFFPIVNQGEMAVLYCFLFLFIACRGTGFGRVDAKRGD
jgi:putative oxidoreductase